MTGAEIAARLHLQTGQQFDIAERHSAEFRAIFVRDARIARPTLLEAIKRGLLFVHATVERARAFLRKRRRLRAAAYAFDVDARQRRRQGRRQKQ
ncbi:MAG: hypothetical protein ACLQE9_15125 [Roseiarcus sp.]